MLLGALLYVNKTLVIEPLGITSFWFSKRNVLYIRTPLQYRSALSRHSDGIIKSLDIKASHFRYAYTGHI